MPLFKESAFEGAIDSLIITRIQKNDSYQRYSTSIYTGIRTYVEYFQIQKSILIDNGVRFSYNLRVEL